MDKFSLENAKKIIFLIRKGIKQEDLNLINEGLSLAYNKLSKLPKNEFGLNNLKKSDIIIFSDVMEAVEKALSYLKSKNVSIDSRTYLLFEKSHKALKKHYVGHKDKFIIE